MKIRKETPSDATAIGLLTVAAFKNAAHTDHTEQFVVSALRHAGQLTVSLVAEDSGLLIGHVAISPVRISDGATDWYGLGPISVSPEHQGQGIGSQLMRQALAELQSLGAAGCVVLGEPGYYSRFGFNAETALVLADVPPEYFQAVSFNGSPAAGMVSYDDAFAASSDPATQADLHAPDV